MRVFGARSAVFSGFLIILCATRALVPHYTADVLLLPLCSAVFSEIFTTFSLPPHKPYLFLSFQPPTALQFSSCLNNTTLLDFCHKNIFQILYKLPDNFILILFYHFFTLLNRKIFCCRFHKKNVTPAAGIKIRLLEVTSERRSHLLYNGGNKISGIGTPLFVN
jgi:hypothetical protein